MARIQKKNEVSKASRPFNEYLDEQLRNDPELAVEYLNTAMEDEDKNAFVIALGDVARAYGISDIAEETGLNRTALYRMLKKGNNPRLASLESILDAIGMRLRIERKESAA